MSTEVGRIHYALDLNKDGFDRGADGIATQIGSLSKKLALFATASATAFATWGVKVAGDMESARQGFKALLGSAEEADATMNRIKQEAKATPFELAGLTTGAQALTAITKDGNKAIDVLLDVGKAVAISGKGQAELDRVIFNLQQISATGKVTAMDIRQFQSAIPIFNDIVEASGITVQELQESENQAELLFEAFRKAGAEGGIAVEGFTAQAGTFNQLLSNAKDSMMIFASEFVKQTGIFDFAKDTLGKFAKAIEENQESIYAFVERLKELGRQAIEVGIQIWEYLQPKLQALWNNLKEELIPVLMDLWQNVIEPLIPVLGTVLVGAIGLVIDAINIMVEVFGTVTQWIRDANPVLMGFVAFFGILKGAMVFNAVVNAIIVQFNLLKLVHIPQLMTSFGLLKTAIATPMVMPAIAVALAIASIVAVYNEYKKLQEIRRQVGIAENALGDAREDYGKSLKARYERGEITAEERARLWKATAIDRLDGKAIGGTVMGNRPYLVGERGPEMFIPRSAGKIMTNSETMGMGSTNIYGNITLGNDVDVDNFFRKLTRNQELSSKGLATQAGSLG